MNIENIIGKGVTDAVLTLYGLEAADSMIQLQETRKEFNGDITLVTFPFLKASKKSPELTGNEIGTYLKEKLPEVEDYSVIKGFLNLVISRSFWLSRLNEARKTENFGTAKPESSGHSVMVEYSSPNTNKPLHLGHIRNNLLGYSISKILKANGHKVIMVNLVNDRGIHICKSMLAWQKWGNGETPGSSGKKGDHLVGDYYVKFDLEYKKQIQELIAQGQSEADAEKNAPLIREAQKMLRLWEAKDPAIVSLWEMMNNWVYAGFDQTYKQMGIEFDRIYHESQTYLHGKAIVQKGLEQGILFSKPDHSVWADLTKDGLDEKLLLRSDGTSVYMTQDLGTACQRFDEYHVDEMIYVVGNEQNYHFQVLALVLQKLGYSWASQLKHMSYGMVELPSGKMKSREGTVVDADDLIQEMIDTAREMSIELGKLEGFTTEQAEKIFRIIGLGALKYFILKVDPKKNMLFDPKESVDFNGNTGPFIQYTYARIQSVLRKASDAGLKTPAGIGTDVTIDEKEKQLIKLIYRYPSVIKEAGENLSPALIANYVFELAKEYNQFYHDYPIIKEEKEDMRDFRLLASMMISDVIQSSMTLLGIEVPEKM
jgi:arginyl-tRNA synthetase